MAQFRSNPFGVTKSGEKVNVLFTIPLAFTGGLLGMLLTGQQLTMISLMGFIVLMLSLIHI